MTRRSSPSFAIGPMPHGCDIRVWHLNPILRGHYMIEGPRCDQPAVARKLDGDYLCQKHANQWVRGEDQALWDRELEEIQARSDEQAERQIRA